MSGETQCPQCATRFRVTEAQLGAHQGLVRCGRCQQVFDGRPADQRNAVMTLEISEAIDTLSTPSEPSAPPPRRPYPEDSSFLAPKEQARRWPWALAIAAGSALFALQVSYSFRVELSANWPELRPALIAACQPFGCGVPLPQQESLLTIETSSLEAAANVPHLLTVSALLRNQAGFEQALPNLLLTLLDSNGRPLSRRSFPPAEYLPSAEQAPLAIHPAAIPANGELEVTLRLAVSEIEPDGYRLLAFYPKN